jgi:hypothetical protein
MNRSFKGVAGILLVAGMGALYGCMEYSIGEPEEAGGEAIGTALEPISPPGDCTGARHRTLQDEVNSQCKTAPFSCKKNMARAELQKRFNQATACSNARKRINSECFKGGDSGHKQAAENASRAADKCAGFMR